MVIQELNPESAERPGGPRVFTRERESLRRLRNAQDLSHRWRRLPPSGFVVPMTTSAKAEDTKVVIQAPG